MANLCRCHRILNGSNDADNGAAAEQQKAVLTRQKTEGKSTRYKGGFTLDSGKVLAMLLKQQSMRQSCQWYKLTHIRQGGKEIKARRV